jgi:hypothetical protein
MVISVDDVASGGNAYDLDEDSLEILVRVETESEKNLLCSDLLNLDLGGKSRLGAELVISGKIFVGSAAASSDISPP